MFLRAVAYLGSPKGEAKGEAKGGGQGGSQGGGQGEAKGGKLSYPCYHVVEQWKKNWGKN